ncbi:MAG TPA: MBL fold metallo-hydrolase [Armatimonadota bacterium]|nr:MBL fold metallo-hydrolase [Armatimonadota bacterium]
MSKLTVVVALVFIMFLGAYACAEEAPIVKDPVTFPADGVMGSFGISDYIFGVTNCYLLASKGGQAILIDPADKLERVADVTILVDIETRHATTLPSTDLGKYTSVSKDTVKDPATGKTYLVYDQYKATGTYGPQIMQILQDRKLTLKYIILTHGHMDHFGSLDYLKQKTGAEILMHGADIRGIDGSPLSDHAITQHNAYPKDAYRFVNFATRVDRVLKDGDLISSDGIVLQVIHTPGHSPGSICLRTKQGEQTILFSGDTLFRWGYKSDAVGNLLRDDQGNPVTDDVGRTNFIDGSGDEPLLYRSIRRKLFILPDDTIVLPAHGVSTTIGEEKKYGQARFIPLDETVENIKKPEGDAVATHP